MNRSSRAARFAAGGALIVAGLGAGVALGTTGSATAAGSGSSGSSTSASAPATPTTTKPDQSQPQRADEKLLTGSTATKVRELALAKYPGATIERVETDSDGVYEAHIVTKAGAHLIVQVGKDFTVTGTQSRPAGPGGGRPGMGTLPNGTAPGGAAS